MPEAPDLEVIKDVLNRHVRGLKISSARVLKPLELRVLATEDFVADVISRSILGFTRRGKFLIAGLSGDRALVINPMLTGAVQLCPPSTRIAKRTSFLLDLADGGQLRYLDDTQMGMAYYVNASQNRGGATPRRAGPGRTGRVPGPAGVPCAPAPLSGRDQGSADAGPVPCRHRQRLRRRDAVRRRHLPVQEALCPVGRRDCTPPRGHPRPC